MSRDKKKLEKFNGYLLSPGIWRILPNGLLPQVALGGELGIISIELQSWLSDDFAGVYATTKLVALCYRTVW